MRANKFRMAPQPRVWRRCLFSWRRLARHLPAGDGPEAMSMGNMCMVMFGYDMIHITSYLPGQSRNEYCEEIPSTGKVIMVFDIENPHFRDMPIEIRIIRDPLDAVEARRISTL